MNTNITMEYSSQINATVEIDNKAIFDALLHKLSFCADTDATYCRVTSNVLYEFHRSAGYLGGNIMDHIAFDRLVLHLKNDLQVDGHIKFVLNDAPNRLVSEAKEVQLWYCEVCGMIGAVVFEKSTDFFSAATLVRDQHNNQASDDCPGSSRAIVPENIKESMIIYDKENQS